MTSNQSLQNNPTITGKFDDLITEAKKINEEIDETNKNARQKMKEIDDKVNKSVEKVDKICSDLDAIDKEAGDKLDTIILNQIRDSVGE